jgi:hypothetical protein
MIDANDRCSKGGYRRITIVLMRSRHYFNLSGILAKRTNL